MSKISFEERRFSPLPRVSRVSEKSLRSIPISSSSMADGISTCFVAALTTRDSGFVSFPPAASAVAVPPHLFVDGRLLSLKRHCSWFFGRSLFITADYDGRKSTSVAIDFFQAWFDVFGLPPKLRKDEAVEMVGETIGQVNHLARLGIRRGKRVWARVRIAYQICDPVKEASPPVALDFCLISEGVSMSAPWEVVMMAEGLESSIPPK